MANGVTDREVPKKRAILLTVCGAQAYKLLRSLVDDGKVDEKSYDELVELLSAHYSPKRPSRLRSYRDFASIHESAHQESQSQAT